MYDSDILIGDPRMIVEQDGQKFDVSDLFGAAGNLSAYATIAYVDAEIAKIPGGGTVTTVAWSRVTEKPSTFTPSPHLHDVTDIDGLDEYLSTVTITAKSAYQSWLEQPGNAGKTEAEFVESLQGEKGDPGDTQDLTGYATVAYVDAEIAKIETGGGGGETLANTSGLAATAGGTAGTATTAARGDHTHPLQTSVTGNAGTATKLVTARTITLTGDCSGSAFFDGSQNITITTTTAGGSGGVQLGNTVALAAGTATAGTATTAARSDHVHPLQTTVTGNAGTATKLATARTITLTGDCTGSASFDGSKNITIATTSVGGGVLLGSTAGAAPGTAAAGTATTAARSDHVHPLQTTVSGNAGTATKLATARTITISGSVSGSASFDGSSSITISTTGGAQLGSATPKVAGTAAAGTATTAARSDHVHPLQTTVSGNAGTATKLATSRTITLSGAVTGSGSFDGSGNLSIATTSNITGLQLGSTTPKAAGTAAVGTATTAAKSDHVHPLQTTVTGNAGTATKLATSRTITISGAVSGSGAFDGSGNLSIATTSNITGLQLGSTTPKAAGTAAVGTATTAAKSDHVHPLQTTVTGNAGTATALATSRTIALTGTITGSASFNGTANASISTKLNTTNSQTLDFWTGTAAQLPTTRSAGVLYIATES